MRSRWREFLTPQAGSIISAIRFIAKALLTGQGLSQICEKPLSASQAAGNLTSDKGIGEPFTQSFDFEILRALLERRRALMAEWSAFVTADC